MNRNKKSVALLPFPVIAAAAGGDTEAMCAVLKHYEGYIATLCTRTLKDDAGNTYSYVDEEMKNRLPPAGRVPLSALPLMSCLSFHRGIPPSAVCFREPTSS